MDLYIIRHAWAEERDEARWPDDSLRPLTAKGETRFASFAKLLVSRGMRPGVIATSPMLRCRRTAEILSAALGGVSIVPRDELLSDGDLDSLLAWTNEQEQEHTQVAWVGHVPDVEQMTGMLIGSEFGSFHFGKGAVASIRFDGLAVPEEGELRWLASAKLFGL